MSSRDPRVGAYMIGVVSMVLAMTTVNVAVPDVMGAFGIGQDKAQWMSSAYTATMTASPTATYTPVCSTLLNGCETLAENGSWTGANAVRSIVNAGRYPVRNEIDQQCFLTGGRCFQKFDQLAGLLGGKRQRWNPQSGTFCHMGAVRIQHVSLLF